MTGSTVPTARRRPVPVRAARWALDHSVGELPVRNRLLQARSLHRLPERRRYEVTESARFVAGLGGRPKAFVATVIPTFDRPALLRLAVESALAQTVDDHVVVVVSDGRPVHLELQHPRLVVLEGSRNTRLPAISRNIGRRVTDSAFVAHLDDDNTWYPDHLERSLAALAEHPDAVLSYAGLERVLPDGRRHSVLGRPMDRSLLRNDNFVDSNGVVMRRAAGVWWSRAARYGGRFPVEDWELGWRTSRSGGAVYSGAVTVRYLINPGSHYTPEFRDRAAAELDAPGPAAPG